MSRVYLLAADKELPLCDFQKPRASHAGGYAVTLQRASRWSPCTITAMRWRSWAIP